MGHGVEFWWSVLPVDMGQGPTPSWNLQVIGFLFWPLKGFPPISTKFVAFDGLGELYKLVLFLGLKSSTRWRHGRKTENSFYYFFLGDPWEFPTPRGQIVELNG